MISKTLSGRGIFFYYHLWLNEAPNLLNFAVAELPLNAFRETYHVSRASDDDDKGGGTNVSEDATSSTTSPRIMDLEFLDPGSCRRESRK